MAIEHIVYKITVELPNGESVDQQVAVTITEMPELAPAGGL
jgi:hypothetical protein